MSGVTIRAAESEDVSAILRIAERGWHEAYGKILSEETIDIAMAEWYDPSTIQEQIEHDDVAYFVAENGEDIRGYASGGPSNGGTIAMLGAIYVDPEYWGNGIGTALLNAFEGFCRQHGYETIQFEVLAKNDIGVEFYRKHGYKIIDDQETELFGETVREYEFRGQLE